MKLKSILFLCTGNSCRSQLGEAIVNKFYSDTWQAYSAGTQPTGFVHPLAISVLADIGIQHTGNSKHTESFSNTQFDLVITVCEDAADDCPVWLKEGRVVHLPFLDPADATGTDAEKLVVFNQVRDEINSAINVLLSAENKL